MFASLFFNSLCSFSLRRLRTLQTEAAALDRGYRRALY